MRRIHVQGGVQRVLFPKVIRSNARFLLKRSLHLRTCCILLWPIMIFCGLRASAQLYGSSTVLTLPAAVQIAVDSSDNIYFEPSIKDQVDEAILSNGSYTTSIFHLADVNTTGEQSIVVDQSGVVWFSTYYEPAGSTTPTCCAGSIKYQPAVSNLLAVPIPPPYLADGSYGIHWVPGPIGVSSNGGAVYALNQWDSTLWYFEKVCNLGGTSCGWNPRQIDTFSSYLIAGAIAVDSSGDLFLPGISGSEIVKEVYSNSGGSYSRQYITVNGLTNGNLSRVAVDENNNLFVTDHNNSVVYELKPDASGGYSQSTIGACTTPVGLAADGNGNVFCVEGAGTVLKFSPLHIRPPA